nr:MAG TPA: hypothetical protein [Herelleviridae sp.]
MKFRSLQMLLLQTLSYLILQTNHLLLREILTHYLHRG